MGEPQWQPQDVPNEQDATVRLFVPGSARGGSGDVSLDLTVSEFYYAYYEPVHLVMRDSRPRNLEEIRQSVAYWKLFTRDPSLGAITRLHSRDFVVGLKALPGRKTPLMGNNTVRKHCGAIQAILDFCGPPDRKHRESIGLYEDPSKVPFIPMPPRESPSSEDSFTFSEIQQLIDNADAARLHRPRTLRCPIAVYMRRVYLVLFNAPIRIGGLMGATWKHYHGDHLILPARIVAKGRHSKRVELNDVAQQIIEANRGLDPERIFPWPRSWPSSRHQLHDQHDLIKVCLPEDRQFAFHGVRKGSNLVIARINPKACEKALGNTARVNTEHYTSQALVAETLQKMPLLRTTVDRQGKLFD